MKTPEQSRWRRFGVFIVNFEHISHIHSVSLGSDPTNQNPAILSVLQALKNLKTLISPHVLQMFNNNTYTDFRTAYKHLLIPRYVIEVI